DRARTVPRPAPSSPADDAAARARLGALVSGDVRFELEHDDGFVRGLREGADETTWKRLEGRGFAPEATLDLHGLGREAARKATVDFIRHKHRGGLRYLLVIVGKGNHSEGGVGVLAQVVASALTGSVAAPLVHGFASAHPCHGGRGALAVQLR
ncbi:MAG: Smr/MutS family protein, partial [Myxococcales bacterium]|nr:Smr/MutS family protein [Myxococcales bacterium]